MEGLKKVFVWDSSPFVGPGIRAELEAHDVPGFHVFWTQNPWDRELVAEQLAKLNPDIVVFDAHLGKRRLYDVMDLAQSKSEPLNPAIILQMLGDSRHVRLSRKSIQRLLGVVRRGAYPEQLFECLQAVAYGQYWIEGESPAEQVRFRRALSKREKQVCELFRSGMSNNEIAARLGIKLGTVKVHLGHIRSKAGCQRTSQLFLGIV